MTTTPARDAAAFLRELVDADILDPEAAFELRVEAQRIAAALEQVEVVSVSVVVVGGLVDDLEVFRAEADAEAFAGAAVADDQDDNEIRHAVTWTTEVNG